MTVAVARITNLKLASTGLEERVTSLVDGLETGSRVLSNIIQVWNVLGGMLACGDHPLPEGLKILDGLHAQQAICNV